MDMVFLGSCLSASIADAVLRLDPKVKLRAHLSHMRSDVFREVFIDESCIRPGRDVLKELFKKHGDEKSWKNNERRAIEQCKDRNKIFADAVKKADIFLIDTNYEINASLYEIAEKKEFGKLSFLANKEAIKQKEVILFNQLSPAQVNENFSEIIRWIKELNPAIRIYIVNFPVSGFVRTEDTNRINRSKRIASETVNLPATVFPLIDIPKTSQSAKGAHYFSDDVYEAYAKYILEAQKGQKLTGFSAKPTLDELKSMCAGKKPAPEKSKIKEPTPYDDLPARNFWKTAVADKYPLSVENIYYKNFRSTSVTKSLRAAAVLHSTSVGG